MNSFNKEKHEYLIDGKRATGVTTIISVLAKPNLIQWAANEAVKYMEQSIVSHITEDGHLIYEDIEEFRVHLEEARTAHTKKKEAAGTHGTDAHALVEEWIKWKMNPKGEAFQYPIIIEPFVKWAEENVDHFLFSERQMFNKELFIAGTADFGCVMKDGKKLIGDFKTSSGLYGIDYFLQCAGYKILAEAEGDAPYDGCVIVRLGKKGPQDFDVHYRYAEQSTKSQPEELWKRLMGWLGVKQTDVINYSDVDAKAFMACLTLYRAQATYKKPN